MKSVHKKNGFTLVELMIALLVGSVVMAAAATLASATTNAHLATDQMGREQAQLRQVSMRLTDLIRRANRVMSASSEGFQLWHDTNADGLATANELTQVSRGTGAVTLKIGAAESHSRCRNISFGYNAAAPDTRLITVWFDMSADGQTQRQAITARLRSSDDHRLF
ncbi:MAG: prepilin-type N-terminal cleavage/methylation domain-containing protein [Planctomycetales bacterium]|nr:prepilin-type N-terminal cleavage/methylation domain-containing protein [Planctomycetales bacterium]